MKHLRLVFVLLLLSSYVATCTTITASQPIQDPRGGLFSGRIVFVVPSPATRTDTNAVVIPLPITVRVNNGALVGSLTLASNDILRPKMYYTAWYYDTQGHPIANYNYYINGTTFDLGTAALTPITTANISTNVLTLQSLTVTGTTTLSTTTAANFSVSALTRDCRQDGLVADGSDQSAALQLCDNNALAANQAFIQLPCGPFKLNTSLNHTNRPSMRIKGCGTYGTNNTSTVGNITFITCNTGAGTACIDATGSGSTFIEDLTLRIDNTSGTPSSIAILFGRDNSLGGGTGRFCFSEHTEINNVSIWTDSNGAANIGGRGYIGLYNIGAENGSINNSHIFANLPLYFSTANDLSIASLYQTLATGCPASMSVYKIMDTTIHPISFAGIEAHGTIGIDVVNGSFAGDGVTAGIFPVLFNGADSTDFTIDAVFESFNAPASGAISMAANVSNLKAKLNIGGQTGAAAAAIVVNTGFTLTNPDISIRILNGTVESAISTSGSITVNGGVLDIGGTTSPISQTGITLTGTKVNAQGFVDGNVTFNAASKYTLTDDTGVSVIGSPFVTDSNTVALTADWTCGTAGTVASCTTAVIVGSGGGVPLTFTLPLATHSWTWECNGVVGQATAATANSWNFLTATNGATNVTANYSMNTAATAMTGGAITDVASTTTTQVIAPTWTLGGTGTKMPFRVWGRVEGASSSGTVLSLQLVAPTVGDLVTIYRGTQCSIR